MAKIEMKGLDKYAEKLRQLGARADGVIKYAVYPGAAIVADEIKSNIPVDTGALRDSMKLSAMRNDDGYVYTEIYFDGYDEKGAPNAVKARVLESGSSTRQKRPFIRQAVNRVKAKAEAAMAAALDEKINEIMNS